MKRWDAMAKAFTKFGKEIAIAVKQAGPDANTNPRLRIAIQNAKGVNMPKDRIENAIKKASSKDEKDFQEVLYEGYGPHGIAIVVECATDNPTRTVANIRSYFTHSGGSLSTSGALDFMFTRKGVFKLPSSAISNKEDFELEMIDFGLEEIVANEEELLLYTTFSDFSKMQKALEEKSIAVTSAELQRFPTTTKEITEAQEEELADLIDKIEEDEDVQAVYHTMK
ncbi:MAG: YebC/PmpR family DNA-binding transcriptional regulator [Ignavibacteriales bacterium]|nr:YebC/PmpR family DNA-binding transcriptional regulator [Ignavibacteriales bacterium]